MAKVLGVGIIGCGNISSAYLKLAPLFKSIEIRAVADIDLSVAKARGDEFKVKAQDVKGLLKNDDVDIIVNLTVPAVHYNVSRKALDSGKHVYSEKPLTLSIKDAADLVRRAKKSKLKVAAAPDTFLGGSHQFVRKTIDEGKVGKIVSGTAHVLGYGMEHWHPNPDFFFLPGGGPILDMGPYYITNLIQLLGPVRRVAALSGMARKERIITSQPRNGEKLRVKTPTTYNALLEFHSGAMITLGASWDVYANRHQHMELYGSEGAIFVPDPNFFGGDVMMAGADAKLETLAQWNHPFGKPNWPEQSPDRANYRCAGLADMAEGIINKRDIRCSIERALHCVDVMTSIMKSGESRKFVEVKSKCTRPKVLDPAEARSMLR